MPNSEINYDSHIAQVYADYKQAYSRTEKANEVYAKLYLEQKTSNPAKRVLMGPRIAQAEENFQRQLRTKERYLQILGQVIAQKPASYDVAYCSIWFDGMRKPGVYYVGYNYPITNTEGTDVFNVGFESNAFRIRQLPDTIRQLITWPRISLTEKMIIENWEEYLSASGKDPSGEFPDEDIPLVIPLRTKFEVAQNQLPSLILPNQYGIPLFWNIAPDVTLYAKWLPSGLTGGESITRLPESIFSPNRWSTDKNQPSIIPDFEISLAQPIYKLSCYQE